MWEDRAVKTGINATDSTAALSLLELTELGCSLSIVTGVVPISCMSPAHLGCSGIMFVLSVWNLW
jgi:hypothetical protein